MTFLLCFLASGIGITGCIYASAALATLCRRDWAEVYCNRYSCNPLGSICRCMVAPTDGKLADIARDCRGNSQHSHLHINSQERNIDPIAPKIMLIANDQPHHADLPSIQ